MGNQADWKDKDGGFSLVDEVFLNLGIDGDNGDGLC